MTITIINRDPPKETLLDRKQSITFELEVTPGSTLGFMIVWIKFANREETLVAYDGTDWEHPFDTRSAVELLGDGNYRVSVMQTGGWEDDLVDFKVCTIEIVGGVAVLGPVDDIPDTAIATAVAIDAMVGVTGWAGVVATAADAGIDLTALVAAASATAADAGVGVGAEEGAATSTASDAGVGVTGQASATSSVATPDVDITANLPASVSATAAGSSEAPKVVDWTRPALGDGLDINGTATLHWELSESSGDFVEDIVGGGTHDFSAVGSGHHQGLVAPGFSDGSSLTSYSCVETRRAAGTGNRYESSGDALRSEDESIGIRFWMRKYEHQGQQHIIGNRAGGGAGWQLRLLGTLGTEPCLIVHDGTNEVQARLTATSRHIDGGWHWFEIVIDWSTDTASLRSDIGTATGDLSTLTQGNTSGNANLAFLGSPTLSAAQHMQIFDMYGWEGTAAENLLSDSVNDISAAHFLDPNLSGTYQDDDIAYGAAGVPVPAYDYVPGQSFSSTPYYYLCSGNGTNTNGPQFPAAYSTKLVDRGLANGWGRWNWDNADWTNLVNHCHDIENSYWTTSSMAKDVSDSDLKVNLHGFKFARRARATSNNGQLRSGTITVANSTAHVCWVWIRGRASSTQTGRLIAYDVSGASETASTTWSVTNDTWVLVGFKFTTASTSLSIRFEIDNSGDNVHPAHFGLVESDNEAFWRYGPPQWGKAQLPASGWNEVDHIGGAANGLASTEWIEGNGTWRTGWIGDHGVTNTSNAWGALTAYEGNNDQCRHNIGALAADGQAEFEIFNASGASAGAATITTLVNRENGVVLHGVWRASSELPFAPGVYSRLYATDDTSMKQADGATASFTTNNIIDEVHWPGPSLKGWGLLGRIQRWAGTFQPEDVE